MSTGRYVRLSLMMFLQYAIWGAWLPILWPFLAGHRGFDAGEIGWMFMVGGAGALLAPFIAGNIADRYFNTERFLGISHCIGGVLIWYLAEIESVEGFLVFSLVYSLVYSPTISLTNSLALHHLPNRDRQFGLVRVWGTIGWIAVGIAVGQWLRLEYEAEGLDVDAGRADAFKLSGILGLAMGAYCFTLPKTPPSPGVQQNAAFEAIGEVKRQPLLTLFLLAVPVSCIHQFYFNHTSSFLSGFQSDAASNINKVFGVGGGGLMTIGQIAEILVLFAIPMVAKTVSRKTLLAVGLVAYAGRMALFSYAHEVSAFLNVDPVIVLMPAIALHGLCFGCFIFVAYMIVDEETSTDVRASAQSLFNIVIIGVGVIVGSLVASKAATWAGQGTDAGIDYPKLFTLPMWASVASLLLLIFFYPKRSPREPAG